MKTKISIEQYREKLSKVSEIEFARLAAYIDGEGCITISTSPARGKKAITRNHNMVITVTNTSPLLFGWLLKTFGGVARPANNNTLPCWRWIVSEIHSEEILRRCLPYFVIKEQQAKIGIAFREIKKWTYQECHNRPITAEMLAERDEMYWRMRTLNSGKGFNREFKISKTVDGQVNISEKVS